MLGAGDTGGKIFISDTLEKKHTIISKGAKERDIQSTPGVVRDAGGC